MVMTTGMMRPSWAWVWALKVLQNSIMLTPCWPRAGPTGGEGLALPAGTCSFTWAVTFLATRLDMPPPRWRPSRASDPLHLEELEVHRGRPAEDAHHDLEPPLVRLDLLHHPREVGEGA